MAQEKTKRQLSKHRRSSLTPVIHETIVNAVRLGMYLDDAAAIAGIGRSTLFLWLQKGQDIRDSDRTDEELTQHERDVVELLDAVEKARADATLRNIGVIQQAASDGTWQAAAWYLERTNPKKWGRHETVEITGADGGPIQVQHSVKDALAEKFRAAEVAARNVIEATVVEDEPKELRKAK
jgi:transposase